MQLQEQKSPGDLLFLLAGEPGPAQTNAWGRRRDGQGTPCYGREDGGGCTCKGTLVSSRSSFSRAGDRLL